MKITFRTPVNDHPEPISASELRARLQRISALSVASISPTIDPSNGATAMMTKKTAAEIKAQVAQMLKELPEGWLEREMAAAKGDPNRDVKTLEMICAALEDQVKKQKPKKKQPRRRTTRVS